MENKYSNGMYKTTSKKQNAASLNVHSVLYDLSIFKSMSLDFNQVTGNCDYHYVIDGYTCDYVLTIDRTGKITNRAWEG